MSSSSRNLPLRAVFIRALQLASKASILATMDNETQNIVVTALSDLKIVSQGIETSGMFSPNESLDDIPTRSLPYLLVEYVRVEMEGRLRTPDSDERMKRLRNSQRSLQIFLHRLHHYEIIPDQEQKLYSKKAHGIKDPAQRRELKIKQFQTEKELRGCLEIIRKRTRQPVTSTGTSDDFGLITSMLFPSSTDEEPRTGGSDDEDDEELRRIYLLIIRLMWVQAQSQLESIEKELELLHNIPSLSPELPNEKEREDPMWRLDSSIPRGGPDGKGPLMDSSGRPLRPFTILPGSTSSERSRMQAAVFRPDHRLPTMTMDDYLEEEERRGNIITGGGPQSQLALTRSEHLTLASEMDGSTDSEQKAEEKRQEDERWARYTDLHPKGEGNTMNRG